MNNSLERIKSQALELWQNTSNGKKAIVGVLLLVFIIAIGFSIQTATTPDMRPLFTGMDAEEAGAIVANLKENKIEYQLTDNGTTILVPSKDLDQTRLDLASQGLPTGGVVGFESLDGTNFGETDTAQKAKYMRALQGELTRTVKQLAEVENARVHIVAPEPTLFSEDQKDTTASLMLKLKPYKKLSSEQITGLVRLVSSSVEGLKPENITILDTNMNDLTDLADVSKDSIQGGKLTATQIELQSKVQADLEKKAQSMLERVMGPGKAVVRVSAELDFDHVETRSEDWGDKVLRSQQTSDEEASGQNTTPSGAPGTVSNTPSVPTYQAPDQVSNSQTSKSEKINNYEIDRHEENRVIAPGGVKRLTVAVMVNGQQINSKQQDDIQSAVSNAVGLNTGRGDMISVTSLPFNTDYQDEMKDAMAKDAQMRQYLIFGGIGAALVALLIAFVIMRRRNKPMEEVPMLTVGDMIGQEQVAVSLDDEEELPEEIEAFEPPEPELTPEEIERVRVFEELEKLAKQNPNDVAQLLKTWMADE